MRYAKQIQVVQKQEQMITAFRGYNHNEIIADNELYDTRNLSADQYPTLSLRQKRGITSYDEAGQQSVPLLGVHGREELTMIRGNAVMYGGTTVEGISVSTTAEMQPKQIIGFGAYVCIWPDKVYFNTTDLEDSGRMDRIWKSSDHVFKDQFETITAQICRGDGTEYDMNDIEKGDTPPADPADGDLWIDESGEKDVLRQWSNAKSEWVEVPTVYIKISANDIGKDLGIYDAVDISGCKYDDTRMLEPDERIKAQIEELNGRYIIYDCGTDYIIIVGMLSETVYLDPGSRYTWSAMEVNRNVPDLEYIVESNNRLWGCTYGAPGNKELWHGYGYDVSMAMLDKNGNEIQTEIQTSTYNSPPENPQDGDLWIKIDENGKFILCEYWSTLSKWVGINGRVKIKATGIGKGLTTGRQTIRIKGLSWLKNQDSDPSMIEQLEIDRINGKYSVLPENDDYIIVSGPVLTKKVDHAGGNVIQEPHNTVFVFKEEKEEKNFLNEIHACKLGDFKNWSTYMGLSTDSYTASVGTDGPFTGAATQLGYPIFFKENCIHRVYGNTPDSFQIQTTMCRGLQEGSWRSAVVVNETIYYKSRTDVMRYDGNMPASVSEQLGKKLYSDARAGAVNGKYYISMKDEANGKYYQFAYDTKLGIWYREDKLKALMYATVKDEMYLIDEENNTLVTIYGSQGEQEEDLEWMAVFGISGIEYTQRNNGYARADIRGNRYLSRFDLRMYMEEDSTAEMYIEYNSDGQWKHQGTIKGRNTRSFVIPVIPYRCDHLRVKLEGKGDFRIFSISRILEVGSDG